jgi:hypothetical protein
MLNLTSRLGPSDSLEIVIAAAQVTTQGRNCQLIVSELKPIFDQENLRLFLAGSLHCSLW